MSLFALFGLSLLLCFMTGACSSQKSAVTETDSRDSLYTSVSKLQNSKISFNQLIDDNSVLTLSGVNIMWLTQDSSCLDSFNHTDCPDRIVIDEIVVKKNTSSLTNSVESLNDSVIVNKIATSQVNSKVNTSESRHFSPFYRLAMIGVVLCIAFLLLRYAVRKL